MDLEHEERLTRVEDLAEHNSERLNSVEQRQDNLDKLVESVARLASDQKHMEGDVKEIKDDVKNLVAKPGKRFDSLVDKIVWAILAAVIAFLLARLGL